MRSVWPVIGGCALALACGRPNPGFKLIDSSDGGGSEGLTTSLVSTDSGPATTTPTSTGDSGSTTASEGSASTVSSDPSGSTTTGAGQWVFPTDCGDDYLESDYTDAALDTFFLNEVALQHCSFIDDMANMTDCQDMQFSLSGYFQLFLQADGGNPKYDYVGVYGVRYAQPKPMHDGNIPIPEEAFLAVEARVRMFRPFPAAPWAGLKLNIRSFASGDTWSATEGYDFTPCMAPQASFRCRICPGDGQPVDGPCTADWATPELPYDPMIKPVQVASFLNEPDPEFGADLLVPFTKEDLPWLTTEGMMVMPALNTPYGTIEVKTLESGMPEWRPGLRVRYCEPYFDPA